MYLRKSIKSFELLFYRQKCLNWCQIVVNRRYLSEDNNENNTKDEKSIEPFDGNRKQRVSEAKEGLNQLIHTLKSNPVFGASDPKLNELLAKPRFHIRRSARKEEEFNKNEEPIDEISAKIEERLVMAAKGIAKTLSGKESKDTENDLLRILKLQVIETNLAKEGRLLSKEQLASLFGDLKVAKDDKIVDQFVCGYNAGNRIFGQTEGKAEQSVSQTITGLKERRRLEAFRHRRYEDSTELSVSQSLKESRHKEMTDRHRVNLFFGESIGIFDADMQEANDLPKMHIWDQLMREELESIVAQPPKNAFEEMIRWTEEGKLWKYPINNEQGLEEEESVPFYEHVLLDHLLEGFPEKGPVRKFMELVIMGLASNPYITVGRKEATVQYYRQYFSEKEDMLRISGALG